MKSFLPRLLVALAALFIVAACSPGEDRLELKTNTGTYVFSVELADDDSERARGLMFRQELAADAGMLFDFGEERPVSFWMQNTFIPLDMIFVSTDGVIKAIHEMAVPHDTTAISSGVPVRFVFEIPGGRANEIGLAVGDTLSHPRVTKSN